MIDYGDQGLPLAFLSTFPLGKTILENHVKDWSRVLCLISAQQRWVTNLRATVEHDDSRGEFESSSFPRKYRRVLTSLQKTGRGTVACPERWTVAVRTSDEFPAESSSVIPVA